MQSIGNLVQFCHSERNSLTVHMLFAFSYLLLFVMVAGYDSDNNLSLAGLTQESRYVDVTTISSDEEPIHPEENFRLLLEGAHKLSSNMSQVSHFDDKIFAMSHGSTLSQLGEQFSQQSSNSMASSMVSDYKVSHVFFTVDVTTISSDDWQRG